MSTSGGNPGEQRPLVFKVPGEVITRDLRQLYIRILKLMVQYRTEFGFAPSSASAKFHQYLKRNGVTHHSQDKLKAAILFMEESFHRTFQERGEYGIFLDCPYLEERFELGKQIWLPLRQDQNQEEEEEGDPDDNQEGYEDHVEDEKQDFMDLAILKSIVNFYICSGGFPEPDSYKLYYLLVRNSIRSIPQDLFVDRILILKEHFDNLNMRVVSGEEIVFRNPRREEINYLSNWIWGHDFDYYDDDDDEDNGDDDDVVIRLDEPNYDDADVVDKERDEQDSEILNCMMAFIRMNKFIPGADSKQFYEFVKDIKPHLKIRRQQLANRVLFLEGNFKRNTGSLPIRGTEIPNLCQREIHELSKRIWGDKYKDRGKGKAKSS